MSVEKGFSSGCGAVFGIAVAVILLVIALTVGGKFVSPCPSCHASGNCVLCGGTGKGILFGDCMNCGGKKSCPNCGGTGWKLH
jgi:hypothetical protein